MDTRAPHTFIASLFAVARLNLSFTPVHAVLMLLQRNIGKVLKKHLKQLFNTVVGQHINSRNTSLR